MPRPSDEAPTLILLHLGKTAGWTLTRVLDRNVSPAVRIGNPASTPSGFLSREPIRTFAGWPEEERARPRLISAHMIFGIHEWVPRPSQYISLLRKPIARAISGYYRVLETPTHRLYEEVAMRGMSLDEYVTSGVSLEVDNSQTRAIAGDIDTPFGRCTRDMLERAIRNIEERFPVVGLTERFDEMLILLRRTFGWTNLRYVKANVTKGRSHRGPVSQETRRTIEDLNRLDVELYRRVEERFEEAIAGDPSFASDLERFRRSNAMYQPWGHLTYTYPRRVRARLFANKRARTT